MKAYEQIIDVLLDGRDEPITVYVDQRDFAAWEVRPEAEIERAWALTRDRFVTWHAAKRAGQYGGDWKTFNEKDAIQLAAHPEPEEDDGNLPKAS